MKQYENTQAFLLQNRQARHYFLSLPDAIQQQVSLNPHLCTMDALQKYAENLLTL